MSDLENLAKINQNLWKAGYKEGKKHMAFRAIQIWRSMKDKKSLAGNLWHSDEEIEEAIEKEAEK